MPYLSRRQIVLAGGASALAMATGLLRLPGLAPAEAAPETFPVMHTDAEWRKLLTPSQYSVLRRQGTETPFSSPLNHEKRAGLFSCAGCEQAAFSSKAKFDSGTGWPSFWQPLDHAVDQSSDRSLLMERTEVHCNRCGGHLGHVFNDGPQPTGLRYCMNGVALAFRPGEG
jgi:peptide-methionine (R)-S-oxide reductase